MLSSLSLEALTWTQYQRHDSVLQREQLNRNDLSIENSHLRSVLSLEVRLTVYRFHSVAGMPACGEAHDRPKSHAYSGFFSYFSLISETRTSVNTTTYVEVILP